MVDAREYHERTNHTPRSVRESGVSLDPTTRPRTHRLYADLPTEPLPGIRPPQQPALAAISHARADPLADAAQPRRERDAEVDGAIDRETVATLCYEAAGVKQQVETRDGRTLRFRTASCTGNLHHVECYLVCGDCGDLDAGVYHFDPIEFRLDVLREGDYRGALADAVGGGRTADEDEPAATVRDAPLSVVATSVWARNAWKYDDRTYRHAFWDSGTVLANLLATAHALDYRAEVLASFADDAVADLVGVTPEREAPIALATVRAAEESADDAATDAAEPAAATAPTDSSAVEPIDPEVVPPTDDPADVDLVHDAWAQSAFGDAEAATEFRELCRDAGSIGRVDDRTDSDADSSPLDAVDAETASARPLHDAIGRRGSCREYARDGPSRRKVATVLDRALRGLPADWTGGGATAGLAYNDAYLLATDVDGLADGAYRVDVGRGALHPLGGTDRAEKAHLALDQDWAGAAHANVYLLADVERVVAELGNRGYRLAQLEAGRCLGRLYLATYAHRELGGTGLTFYDDLVAQRLGSSSDAGPDAGTGQTPTCLFAFGTRGDR